VTYCSHLWRTAKINCGTHTQFIRNGEFRVSYRKIRSVTTLDFNVIGYAEKCMERRDRCDKISEFLPVIKSPLYTSKNIILKENIALDIVHRLELCKHNISETASIIIRHRCRKFRKPIRKRCFQSLDY
jgi:hypothetical protein